MCQNKQNSMKNYDICHIFSRVGSMSLGSISRDELLGFGPGSAQIRSPLRVKYYSNWYKYNLYFIIIS